MCVHIDSVMLKEILVIGTYAYNNTTTQFHLALLEIIAKNFMYD